MPFGIYLVDHRSRRGRIPREIRTRLFRFRFSYKTWSAFVRYRTPPGVPLNIDRATIPSKHFIFSSTVCRSSPDGHLIPVAVPDGDGCLPFWVGVDVSKFGIRSPSAIVIALNFHRNTTRCFIFINLFTFCFVLLQVNLRRTSFGCWSLIFDLPL